MRTNENIRTRLLRRLLTAGAAVALAAGSLPVAQLPASAATPPTYVTQGSINLTSATPQLTAVDPLAYAAQNEVIPPRPFLYSVDETGLTITRFNDNMVVTPTDKTGARGTLPWPASTWIIKPDGSIMEITVPPGGWEPVAMTVSAPTEAEIANRIKEIPDLTPPPTYVYVVMAHSGYEWASSDGIIRDTLVPSTGPDTESSLLLQIDVSDPSFSAWFDPAAPVDPPINGAILGHGAGQPAYDRATGTVYVGNMPSSSLPANLASFVSVIQRIPAEVGPGEAETPGISIPVIRCGPQHPESGIPVGRPQAFACYDPGGVHPIDDNEHVGAYGNYEWEFRNLPVAPGETVPWLTPHLDNATAKPDGILYGTPPTTGEWFAEARVHDLDDPYGVFSAWTPIRLLVTPTAEYLPIKARFAAGVPVAYPLEGVSCDLGSAPSWVDVAQVPNGCIVMGRAPIDGEYYQFTMGGLTFSGNVFGSYGFDPLPAGVGLSGLAWHQVSKVDDPSTEADVLSDEFIGVEPSTGQLYTVTPPPGKPQPPNDRPPETALTIDVVSAEGDALAGSGFGQVAVEADRDIYVAADGGVIKVSGGTATPIAVDGLQGASLSLDSDLRPARPDEAALGLGQVDHGVLWAAGTGNVALINTDAASVAQSFAVTGASSVTVNFGTGYAYVAGGSSSVAVFGPKGSTMPPVAPRIWSAEEFSWPRGYAGNVSLMATGDPFPTLALAPGSLPAGITFVDNGNGTATLSGTPVEAVPGADYAFSLTATNATGTYAQAFGITVYTPGNITSASTATFTAGAANSFTATAPEQLGGFNWGTPVFYTDNPALLPAGVMLVDNENGTGSLVGTPATAGDYTFPIYVTTGFSVDARQDFTLTVVDPPEGGVAPAITSPNTVTWDTVGGPGAPDNFIVTSTGSPTPALSVTACSSEPDALCTADNLPLGVSFVDNGDSTATLGSGLMALFDGTEGTYTLTITAANGVSPDATQTFTLIIESDTSIMSAAPETLSFAYTSDGPLPEPQSVSIATTGDTLPHAVTSTAPWLKATPVSGTVPGSLSVSADPSGLTSGTYTGTIIVNSAGTEGAPATVSVSLTVTVTPVMSVSANLLSFAYTVTSGKTPAAQAVSLTSGGVSLGFTASTSAAWLKASPASGTTPQDLTVSVDPSKLSIGTYVGVVKVAADGAGNGPQTITVTFIKKATSLTEFAPLVKVSLDVGDGPEGLTIDRTTHDLFINTGNEAAEQAESSSETATVEEPADPAAGSAVFHFAPATGKDNFPGNVVGRTLVHSEGEYIAVNGKTGLVYHASQGTAEIAVIDESTNKAVAYIPLWGTDGLYQRGLKGPYQPYQIGIDEEQNLIYVGAKAPPVPDPVPGADGTFACKAIHEMPDDEYDCWNPGSVFVIDGETNEIVGSFLAGDDPEGVMFAAATGKVYASNEDDGSMTVARGATRNKDGSIAPATVIGTIIKGSLVAGWWQPTCDAKGYCGERGQAALWPQKSACKGIDDEAEEADKMAVDPQGNVYVIDDRYRVAKINGSNDKVTNVLAIPGYDCEAEVPDGSNVVFRNTANNIAFSAVKVGVSRNNPTGIQPRLYVTSEQNTVSLIDPVSLTLKQTVTVQDAVELDAITTDPARDSVFITDEDLAVLWILQGKCADGDSKSCVLQSAPGKQK